MGGILLWLLIGFGAHAGDQDGEAIRLTQEMAELASRNAWDGVERHYEEIVSLGHSPDREAQMLGTLAARSRGDVAVELERMEAAQLIEQQDETEQLIKTLLDEYGRADLRCKPGTVTLTAENQPFRPDFLKAIEFASTQIEQTGHFNGYLPAGGYALGDQTFAARPHTSPKHVDLTSEARGDALIKEVELPKKVKVGNSKVSLNGVGVHVQDYADWYVGALYVGDTSDDGAAIIADPGAKRLLLHVVYRQLSRQQLAEHFTESLRGVPNGADVEDQAKQLATMMEDLKHGDEIILDYVPGDGVVVTVKGRAKGRIKGDVFMTAIWTMYLGDSPPSEPLKTGLLGG